MTGPVLIFALTAYILIIPTILEIIRAARAMFPHKETKPSTASGRSSPDS